MLSHICICNNSCAQTHDVWYWTGREFVKEVPDMPLAKINDCGTVIATSRILKKSIDMYYSCNPQLYKLFTEYERKKCKNKNVKQYEDNLHQFYKLCSL
jgi:hypothetical protein